MNRSQLITELLLKIYFERFSWGIWSNFSKALMTKLIFLYLLFASYSWFGFRIVLFQITKRHVFSQFVVTVPIRCKFQQGSRVKKDILLTSKSNTVSSHLSGFHAQTIFLFNVICHLPLSPFCLKLALSKCCYHYLYRVWYQYIYKYSYLYRLPQYWCRYQIRMCYSLHLKWKVCHCSSHRGWRPIRNERPCFK